MKLRLISVAIIAVAFSLPTLAQNAPKIAVANPEFILQNLREWKDMQAQLEQEVKTLQNIELDKVAKLKDLTSSRDALKSDAPQYAQKNKDVLAAQIDLDVWRRIMHADQQRTFKRQIEQMYDKVTAGVADVAAERHYDLVIAEIKPQTPANLDQVTPQQLSDLLTSRNILFVASQLDITNDVIAAMDAKYTKK
jgi:Skp family chaperone for outer membrane proteins